MHKRWPFGLPTDVQTAKRYCYRICSMKTLITALVGQRRNVAVVIATLLTAGAVSGWAVSTTFPSATASVEGLSAFGTPRKIGTKNLPLEDFKLGLIGSYVVTGTDAGGEPYVGAGILDITLAPSGALELAWDDGKSVGVGQVIGNILAVASSTRGRTVILMMSINPNGSLSGTSSRRTDRGAKGTETWTKT
jgi:hypothetical protein